MTGPASSGVDGSGVHELGAVGVSIDEALLAMVEHAGERASISRHLAEDSEDDADNPTVTETMQTLYRSQAAAHRFVAAVHEEYGDKLRVLVELLRRGQIERAEP